MTNLSETSIPKFGEADLTNCDREPIHIPGSIQPHGVLLALQEPELTIVQVSANVEKLFGISPKAILLSPLKSFLTEDCARFFSRELLESSSLSALNPLAITTRIGNQRLKWDGVLHRSQGLLLLELEPAPERDQNSITSFAQQARLSLLELQGSAKLQGLLETAAREVKRLTHFDRVMVYRFNEGGEGEVVAEVKEEPLEPFLGLHYPASDIPKQARALYEKSWLRLIPDANYKPSPILPVANPLLDAPLDLSFSTLRSVSPIHCEYLQNMGIRASMSVSLLRDGKLWGLIACHHYASEKFVHYEVRTICEFLGQMISWQLSSKIESENNEHRVTGKSHETALMRAMSSEPNFAHGLAKSEQSLLELTQASGAVVCHDGEMYLIGNTPTLDQAKGLIAWLQEHHEEDVFHTNSLAKDYSPASSFKGTASGIMSISISKSNREFLVWLRPETYQTVNWAGDPKKPTEAVEAGARLSPRKSFALWKESVHFQSLPWTPWQIEGARDLRLTILGIIVRKASEIKRLNSDLTKAVRSRDDFLSVASHELKTPLTTLSMLVQLLLKSAKRTVGDLPREGVLPQLEVANQQIARLDQLINNLMDVTKITAGKLQLNVEEGVNLTDLIVQQIDSFRPEFSSLHREILSHLTSQVTGNWDAIRLAQIIANLLSNALKYGGTKPVQLTLEADGKNAVLRVKDEGIGIPEDKLGRIFDRFERAVAEHSYSGLGLGLWISRQIVESMGGTISVKSEAGKGSEFTVELPRHPSYRE